MTNNTIPNVPRELLERAAYTLELAYEVDTPTVRDLRALLSAQSPAGVDGWDVAGDILEKLSAAQAIIDGLRGEVTAIKEQSETRWAAYVRESNIRREIEQQLDQQAQRIGELASHLEFAVTMLTVAGLAGNAQVEAMRAALSAGKEPKQCT